MLTLGCALVVLCAALLGYQNWQLRSDRDAACKRESEAKAELARALADLKAAGMSLRLLSNGPSVPGDTATRLATPRRVTSTEERG